MLQLRHVAVGCLLLFLAPQLKAQQLPTSDQAQRLLQTRPDLVAQLRAQILNSGMTPDQIHARLRAAGYPEDILDPYIGVSRAGRDSATAVLPSEDVIDAVSALGLADSVSTTNLRDMVRRRNGQRAPGDSLRGPRDRRA